MKREQIVWECKLAGCLVRSVQSASISQVGHACGKGKHWRPLFPNKK